MRHELVTDEMWVVVEALLPEERAKLKGGRKRRRSAEPLAVLLRSAQARLRPLLDQVVLELGQRPHNVQH